MTICNREIHTIMADAKAIMVDDHNIPTNNDKDGRMQRLEKELLDLQKERKSTNPFSTVHRWIDVMISDIQNEISSLRKQQAHVQHTSDDDDRDDIGFIFEADEEDDVDDRQAMCLRTPPTQHHITTTKKEAIEKSPTAATLFSSIDDLSTYDDTSSLSVITQGRSLPPLSPSRATVVVSPCPQEEEEDTLSTSKSGGGFIPDHFLFPIAIEEKEFIPDHFLYPIAIEEKDTRKKYDKAKSSFDWYIDEDKFCLYKHYCQVSRPKISYFEISRPMRR